VPAPAPVRIAVYDIQGRRVRPLLDQTVPAGYHSVIWDGRDDGGHAVASGIYLARLRSADFEDCWRISILR
jgi:flagellar hook assembly protein FlgD